MYPHPVNVEIKVDESNTALKSNMLTHLLFLKLKLGDAERHGALAFGSWGPYCHLLTWVDGRRVHADSPIVHQTVHTVSQAGKHDISNARARQSLRTLFTEF
jgi:hypothetical protein